MSSSKNYREIVITKDCYDSVSKSIVTILRFEFTIFKKITQRCIKIFDIRVDR